MPDEFIINLTTEETRVIKLETGAPGPRGEKGDTGDVGPQGPQGDVGPAGPQGEQGPKGDKGDTGAQGIQGPKGDIGEAGPQGAAGQQGIQGAVGADGADGDSAYQVAVSNGFVGTQAEWLASLKGEKGDTGATGAQGPQGIQGATGPQGLQGVQGETGAAGAQGAQGLKGDTGETGAKGEKGDTGNTGETGAAGPGVVAGGITDQILAKNSATDYDTKWVDPPTGGGAVDSVNGQTGVVVLDAADVGAEPALGNPDTDGKVLSSTAAGVRSWVAAGGSSFSPIITDLTGKDIIKYDNNTGEWINAPEDGSSRVATPHSYWRIYTLGANYDSINIAEIQFRTVAGVAELPSGGTPFATSESPANAFDGNATTYWHQSYGANRMIGYHFPSPKIVREVAFDVESMYSLTGFRIEYSDDGTNYYTYTNYPTVTMFATGWNLYAAIDQSPQAKFVKATITSPASGQYVKYDGTKWVNANLPYLIDAWNGSAALTASQVLLVRKAQVAFTLPIRLTGSYALLQTAATASTVLTLTKNGTSIGTITFAAAGTVGTFSFSAAVSFAVGDILKITAPASADATAAGLSINLLGVM